MHSPEESTERIRERPERRFLLLFLVLSLTFVGATAFGFAHRRSPMVLKILPSRPNPTARGSTSEIRRCHILGAVNFPGVYSFAFDATVQDAIQAAGGLSIDADPGKLNLAATVHDQEQIIVPRLSRLRSIDTDGNSEGNDSILVKVNSADSETLQTLPGIGPVLANRIIDYREQNGPFSTIEELQNVKGIGKSKLDQLRSQVTLEP